MRNQASRLWARISPILVMLALFFGVDPGPVAQAQTPAPTQTPAVDPNAPAPLQRMQRRTTNAQRQAAADRIKAARAAAAVAVKAGGKTKGGTTAASVASPTPLLPVPNWGPALPGGTPNYFYGEPNYANSALPTVTYVDTTVTPNATVTGTSPNALGTVTPGTGIRKFVDTLPGLGAANANNLGNYIPIAVPDTTTYPGSDYYTIGLQNYTHRFHSDLPASGSQLRGYVDLNNPTDKVPHYLGPVILAKRDVPVRVKFTNQLPISTDPASRLPIPVDTTVMGNGTGPDGSTYTQNRAELHLHGGASPWISDGTPHQWIVPAGDPTTLKKGASQVNVPDMPDPGDGSATYFWTNQQSNRLMFYHDHSYGITRLNVYNGEAAGYVLTDPVEEGLIDAGVLPNLGGVYRYGIPLIIQDKTFVPPAAQLTAEDPTWATAAPYNWGGEGSLWYPHVYMPNQNPWDTSGANAMGRWDYGFWFWPPMTAANLSGKGGTAAGLQTVAAGPVVGGVATPVPPGTPDYPGMPFPSLTPESFMDTPVVNGAAYPVLNVPAAPVRLRILNAANDRVWNLNIFQADPLNPTEVKMVPSAPGMVPALPANWPMDGRDGGVPDPALMGPSFWQVGNEGGFLPTPVEIPNQPVCYNYNRRDIVVLNVAAHGLLLGPAERADVVVDFTAFAGKTLILYNDAPAPMPAFDTRYDYYTGDPDQTGSGGAPTTQIGYGPNTRTIMQIVVGGTAGTAFNTAALTAAFSGATTTSAFAASQEKPVVPQSSYNEAYGLTGNATLAAPDNYVRISDTNITYVPMGLDQTLAANQVTTNFDGRKAIQELFELDYARMNATLGVELPFTNFNTQTTIPLGYTDPHTELFNDGDTVIWKITHNGVDTHPVHFHLFNVQLINRVGWDGAVRLPDANEIGWKETIRMSPLEDAIVAFRPAAQKLPFNVPPSIRPNDPTQPVGATVTVTNPADGNPMTVTNDLVNFGWEYVWHCHILGHEENDFMRTMSMTVPDVTITGTVRDSLSAPLGGVTLTPSGGGTPVTSAADGTYTITHTSHWVGTVTASLGTFIFAPASYSYSNLITNQTAQDFTATTANAISGTVISNVPNPGTPLAGVTITLSDGTTAITDATGYYQIPVATNWTGTITASLAHFGFAPGAITVLAPGVVGPLGGQNFVGTPIVVVSGTILDSNGAALPNVSVAFTNNGGGAAALTNASGFYTTTLTSGWTGVVTPTLAGYTFAPTLKSFNNLTVDTTQNFTGTSFGTVTGKITVNGLGLAGVAITPSLGAGTTTDASGNYSLSYSGFSAALPLSVTITPSLTNYTFAPTSASLVLNTPGQTITQNFIANEFVTIAGQVTSNGAGLPGVTLTFSGAGSTSTNASGNYTLTVPAPYTGTVTPSIAGMIFTPAVRSYTAQTVNLASENFAALVVLSGTVTYNAAPLAGVTMTYTGGSTLTDAAGNYSITLTPGWSGTVTPSLLGYFFTAPSTSYAGLALNTPNQNYTAAAGVEINGQIYINTVPITALPGVTVTFSGVGSVVTDVNGFYRQFVPRNWTGSATPTLAGYAFNPAVRNFTGVTNIQSGRNFVATAVVTVTGNVTTNGAPLAGVRINFNNGGGTVFTDGAGNYSIVINSGWTGNISASLTGYAFNSPAVITVPITANTTQNFFSIQTITGRARALVGGNLVGIPGVTITLSTGQTAVTNAQGNFTLLVPTGWSGSISASGGLYATWTLTTGAASYTNLTANVGGLRFLGQ